MDLGNMLNENFTINFDGGGNRGVLLASMDSFLGFDVARIVEIFSILNFLQYFINLPALHPLIPIHISHHLIYFFEAYAGSGEARDQALHLSQAAGGRG
jgi:hypothetical protein